ncbi:hypothetical protein ES703_124946 [subsurface metagenome]
MRGNNNVILFKEDTLSKRFCGKDIKGGTSYSFLPHRLNQRLFINEPTPGSINDANRRLDQGQLFGSD